MHDLLNGKGKWTKKDRKTILVKSFGKNYNEKEIKKNVDTLLKGKIVVDKVHKVVPEHGGGYYGKCSGSRPGTVCFSNLFHKENEQFRASTVIHEASHALLGTHDHFTRNPPHTSISHDHPEVKSGAALSGRK